MNAITLASPDSRKWLARAGKIGFWFFFIKGTLWVAAPLVFYWFI